jgi:hypothetical protein
MRLGVEGDVDYPGNVEIEWDNGSVFALRHYDPDDIDGVDPATGLAEGQTLTFPDGTTVTRLGDWRCGGRRRRRRQSWRRSSEPLS